MDDNTKEVATAKSTLSKMQEIHDRIKGVLEHSRDIRERLSGVSVRALGDDVGLSADGETCRRNYACGGLAGEIHNSLDELDDTLSDITGQCHMVGRIA